jgi:hypothetical protein
MGVVYQKIGSDTILTSPLPRPQAFWASAKSWSMINAMGTGFNYCFPPEGDIGRTSSLSVSTKQTK